MRTKRRVDKFVNYRGDVASINEAFAFVMEYRDEFKSPDIEISSYSQYHDISSLSEDDEGEVRYGVSVSGTVS